MSTRRTTRATSRQASSRAVSPAPSLATNATPRRTRRAGNEPLPAVGLRQSTAYGTNTTAQPSRTTGPVVSDQINNVLRGLLAPDPGPAVNTPTQTPASDRTYGIESGLFYGARVESSLPSSPARTSPEPPTTGGNGKATSKAEAEIKALEDLARRRLDAAGYTGPSIITRSSTQLWSYITQLFNFLWQLIKSIFSYDILPYVIIALVSFVAYQAAFSSDLGQSISKYLPSTVRNPLDLFTPDDIHFINKRISNLEYEVARIKSQSSDIDSRALARIEEILPDLLVVKKDKYQNLVIPDDFWTALREKIRSDDTIMQGKLEPIQTGRGTISPKDLTQEIERVSKSAWDRYLKQNQKNMQNMLSDEVAQKFPKLVLQHHLASKDEVVDLLRRNWEENGSHLQAELARLDKKLENASRLINTRLQQNIGSGSNSLGKEEIKAIATETLLKLIPHAQLEALANANLRNAVDSGRVNHFSRATGAIVDAILTSPTYLPPQNNVWFHTRWMRAFINNPVPIPNPPAAALTRWEEYGDCWCANANDSEGVGPSLSVMMGHTIYADQVIVEHIPAQSTLEPGAAPKDMELFAYIEDTGLFNTLRTFTEQVFPEEQSRINGLPHRYVRIAKWTYEADGPTAQVFPLQVDTRSLGASTNKLIVRAKNNWGGENVPFTCLYRVKVHGEIIPDSESV